MLAPALAIALLALYAVYCMVHTATGHLGSPGMQSWLEVSELPWHDCCHLAGQSEHPAWQSSASLLSRAGLSFAQRCDKSDAALLVLLWVILNFDAMPCPLALMQKPLEGFFDKDDLQWVSRRLQVGINKGKDVADAYMPADRFHEF